MNVFQRSKMLLASIMAGAGAHPAKSTAEELTFHGRTKGQLRARRPKPSGAAAQKRAATKRRNKAKHS